jgi:hypothetical protein
MTKKRRRDAARPVEPQSGSFVWGAAAIGAVINRTPRQTNHLLQIGAIKSATKKGALWVASVEALKAEFSGQ